MESIFSKAPIKLEDFTAEQREWIKENQQRCSGSGVFVGVGITVVFFVLAAILGKLVF